MAKIPSYSNVARIREEWQIMRLFLIATFALFIVGCGVKKPPVYSKDEAMMDKLTKELDREISK